MIPDELHGRTVICGNLGAQEVEPVRPAPAADYLPADLGTPVPRILVTGGGGGDAAALVETCIAAMREFRPAVRTRIVLGPEFPADQVPGSADIDGLDVTVVHFETDMVRAIREADVVVSMAGYNTICEVLAAGRRMVLVPRVWPRREQWIRASALGASGRAEVIHPYALTPDSLWSAIARALSQPPSAPQPQEARHRVGQRAAALLPGQRAVLATVGV
jgi:predicted glycosyltransferase